ncbi:PREDICTED: uncharacterized protein LOC109156632 [Ipomoea nil]|uniref:uncharacterized protein LOC109156632 n=1 Tax=Ipomoea nil TaxID=35883 RepID=UPI000900D16B|nr:PREDICTED: uncharacterized protein LOC109156632 [Ipomoea nil]
MTTSSAAMEERLNKREAIVLENSSGLTEVKQALEDNIQELKAHMQNWKDEIMELLRLNKPSPPTTEPFSVQGQVPNFSPGEGNADLGRKPGKEPAVEDPAGLQEVSDDDEGQGENQFGQFVNPMRADRLWVVRCERFFMLARIPRDEIMHVLRVNLTGKVALWYEGYLNSLREGFQWILFARAVCKRFRESNVDVMEEFSNFKQWGNVTDFSDKYEEFKDSFIVRLKQQLRCFVRTSKHTNLEDAIWLARQFEKGLKVSELLKSNSHSTKKTSYTVQKPQPSTRTFTSRQSEPNKSQSSQNSTKTTASNTHQNQTRTPEIHKFREQLREQNRCKGPTFNIIEGTEPLENEEEFSDNQAVETGNQGSTDEENVEVTLNAVIGGEGLNTIKLLGNIGNQAVVCKGLRWQVQKEAFERDLRVLRLGGCDLVLGMDWIDCYAPIQLHTRLPGISFHKEGKRVLLKGMAKGIVLQQASKKEVKRWKKEGAKPVNSKPYRYSFLQKNAIEWMVEEMLTAVIITHSTSPFASPVLLVPKKDNTWRFCVDYRALNGITIKNKFPIPLIEDLFSELANAKVFSKLDLRAGYHQVRMKQGEEYKTTFRTHQGLYEFKVMPFALTNAPATFQAPMNHVFQPLIRKTVLVFFDDILVYSPSLESHWKHLSEVLRIMRDNQLLAKLSKCSFAKREVEYLRHIISEKGLQTDPEKLSAVRNWPKPVNIKELRGFLGLTGYYRRFIKSYGTISRPLTDMLRKNAY